MTAWSEADRRWMREALAEGCLAERLSPPNPAVGAVLVKDGRLIGRGHTQRTGGPHAEVMALADARSRGESTEGATAYVTLEPCSHYGRTPPCALALGRAKVARVVAAMRDPNPRVAGRGLAMLEAAGVECACGLFEEEAWEANVGFFTRMTRGTPWVRMKWAMTLDGRTAFPDGRSQWITGPEARMDTHRWRGRAGAVATGIGTVLADRPQMNVRLPDQVRQPLRVVVDPRLEMPEDAPILHSPGGRVLVFAAGDRPRRAALERAGAEVRVLPDARDPNHVDLAEMLLELAALEVNEVHLEAGPGLSGAFIKADLVDELVAYTAPCFFGEGLGPAAVPLPETPGSARRWKFKSADFVGGDLRMICRRN